ncbi:hypothetical protein [Mesoaciditoga lauensis]|uniref:hypothetical protein n=1 Tax=Mesoaciditoga lauensis TaxID=1495039 RepID=UPI00055E1CF3|nr:hypothetical protein [Mesoaciditoga lauensis]
MEEALSVLKDVKLVIDSAVVLVEHDGDGANKKKKVLELVNEFMKSNNITPPVPISIFNWLVGEAVDITVKWLNDNLWKKETGKKK